VVLWSERQRDRQAAEREAAGESLWTDEFAYSTKMRLISLLEIYSKALYDDRHIWLGAEVARRVALRVGRGLPSEMSGLWGLEATADWLDWLGAAREIIDQYRPGSGASFDEHINGVLRQERVAFKFVDGELIGFESDELHQAVVEPTLRLLVDSRFGDAHTAYLNALKEISTGNAGDAITDAGTALQLSLTALGCQGDVLSTLIADAKAKGLFKSHDQQLHEALILVAKWAASERNKNGDAHGNPDATLADAWLIVHVVGALILRLADAVPRGDAEA
jgi:hypothetical protein